MSKKKFEITGYKTIPLKLTPDSTNCHTIYLREHWIRVVDPQKPRGRTLFLLNVPPYVTKSSLQTFFAKFGKVESVMFSEKPGKGETNPNPSRAEVLFGNIDTDLDVFKVGYVVFADEKSIAKALKLKSLDLFDASGNSLVKTGIEKWTEDYMERRCIPESELQQIIDEYMADYDRREKEAQEAAKTTAADKGGWVTVGKQGRDSGFEQKESVISKIEEKIEKSQKEKELKNFYTFQIRENKMKHIVELRKKYEDDKKRIEMLKQNKRFKLF